MSKVNLEEVLEEYAAATPAGNDLEILQQIAREHTEHAYDLADFAAARAVVKHAPDEELSAEEETRFQESGIKNLRMILSEINAVSIATNALSSLTEAAKSKGLNRSKFAAALGLSVSLVQYLEKRRLAFSTIPHTIVAKIAEVLETGENVVADYLNQSPDFAAQSSFKTNTRAEELPPKSFNDAVREDQQLSAEQKQKLLGLS